MKRQGIDQETMFAEQVSDRGPVFKLYKELLKLNKKKSAWVKNGPETLAAHQRRYTDGKEVYEKLSLGKSKLKQQWVPPQPC